MPKKSNKSKLPQKSRPKWWRSLYGRTIDIVFPVLTKGIILALLERLQDWV